tara:strand:+ start:688 stop:1206 length:519 start_codon:yes stop_codon:yes gene_type:complete
MIETERLTLRPLTADDFENVRALWSHAESEGLMRAEPMGREELERRRSVQVSLWNEQGYGMFAWIDRANGAFVGEGGLSHFRRDFGPDFDDSPEAAWALMPDYQGRRFAQEAMRAVHDWYRETFGACRTVCMIDPGNLPSIRLAQRLEYRAYDERDYRGAQVTLFERTTPGE